MTTFPAFAPAVRSFTPGRHPHSGITTLDGRQIRVRTSNIILDQALSFTFTALTEDQMLAIRAHYVEKQGNFVAFDIPNELLSGMSTPANFTPTNYRWLYANPPSVEDIGMQRYTVNVDLLMVPFEGANINGSNLDVTAGLASGAGTGLPLVASIALTVSATIQGGVATGEIFLNIPALDIQATPVAPDYVGETLAPSYVGAGAYSNGRTSITTAWPAGHQAGDLGIYWLNVNTGSPLGVPAGWTSIATAQVTSWDKLIVAYKYAASSAEPNLVQNPGNYPTAAQILCFRNTAASSPLDGAAGVFNALVLTTPTPTPVNVTTTGGKRYVVSIMEWGTGNVASPSNWATIASVGAGFTTEIDYEETRLDSTNDPGGIVFVMGGVQETAGVSPSATLTMNNTNWQNVHHYRITFALKPR